MAKLQIFIGEDAGQELKEIAENGGFGDDVEVIDVGTEEGFPKVAEMELMEQCAGNKVCLILAIKMN